MVESLFYTKEKFSTVINENRKNESLKNVSKYKINILSNVTNFQFSPILEYSLRSKEIYSEIVNGEFDNIVQDSFRKNKYDCIIIFWDIINFSEDFLINFSKYTEKELVDFISLKKSEISQVLKNLKNVPLVLFNNFNIYKFDGLEIDFKNLEYLKESLNNHLKDSNFKNTKVLEVNKIINNLNLDDFISLDSFNEYKMPYTLNFYWKYMDLIIPKIISAKGKSKKVFILDCDNTLWNGVLGEEGYEGINISKNHSKGKIFSQVQSKLLELKDLGVLLAICSKNNYEDVNLVLENHPDMIIKDKDIIAKEINWNNKVNNIRNISKKLNVGLDSLVFLDDSNFEIDLINRYLPHVYTIKVPSNLNEYPGLIEKSKDLFYQLNISEEDILKTERYKQREQRIELEDEFKNLDDYLVSLKQEIKISINNVSQIERLAQLTQKTNQFNLNTIRLSNVEIEEIVSNENKYIFSLSHSDRFGDSGVTGLSIVNLSDNYPIIEQFLLSCRIIGRKVEESFLHFIISYLSKEGYKIVYSKYKKTEKNKLVKNFYNENNFKVFSKTDGLTIFKYDINESKLINNDLIKINNE
tara:strand:+ start:18168 stop:19916 length:1749 start_codon:yes stop_codon:yes gene_type:complete